MEQMDEANVPANLHYNMFLFKLFEKEYHFNTEIYLHYNMFLFKLINF